VRVVVIGEAIRASPEHDDPVIAAGLPRRQAA
jgi:hypothetical protein